MAQPSASMILTSYCHERWIEEALRGALAQDYPALEILVFDDASTDATWSVLERALAGYRGPHRVALHRQATNVGPSRNGSAAMRAAQGRWMVFADGDDVPEPHRVRTLVEAGERSGAGLVSSNATLISEDGTPQGLYLEPSPDRSFSLLELVQQGWRKEMLGATFGFRRELVDVFGALDPELLPNGGDHVLPVRAGILFEAGVLYLGAPLLRHRQHPGQLTQQVANRSQGELVFQETSAGHDVTAGLQCLRELQAALRLRPGEPRLRHAMQRCTERVLGQVSHWTQVRNKLLNQGLRPTWVEARQASCQAAARAAFSPVSQQAGPLRRARASDAD